jgi:type 1 glutamine amidotransferase
LGLVVETRNQGRDNAEEEAFMDAAGLRRVENNQTAPAVLSPGGRVTAICAVAAASLFISMTGGHAQQVAAPGRAGAGAVMFAAIDANRDLALTRAEMQSAFARWYAEWDRARSGALSEAAVAAGLASVLPAPVGVTGRSGNRSDMPAPNETDVQEMLKVLPTVAPARPARPRRVLVLAHSPGFTHSSIPLAARMVDELGRRTGAWSATVSYDPVVVTSENLTQYDAIVLDSTVGAFLDEAGDESATAARRAAFLAFVRGGKGLVGIHAATDTYHTGAGNTPFTRVTPPARDLAAALVGQGDKDADQRLTPVELVTLIDAWFDAMDTARSGRVAESAFIERLGVLAPAGGGRATGGRGGRGTQVQGPGAPAGGTWPEFNQMIGGIFKSHPWQRVAVKIDDPQSPLTSMFNARTFEFQDEIYSFFMDSWSRTSLHVLMSIDYAKMSDSDKALESRSSARTDGDYGLSWIRREGSGRVFYLALGHREDGIYRSPEMLRHVLAGLQYALGDLKADDSPSSR